MGLRIRLEHSDSIRLHKGGKRDERYTLVLLTALVIPFIVSLILFISGSLGRTEIVFAHRLINVSL